MIANKNEWRVILKKLLRLLIMLVILVAVFYYGFQNREVFLKKIYVIKYSDYVEKYAKKYEVDKYLIYATIKAESNFDANAKSNKGAKGLMQLMDSTGQEIAKKLDMKIDNDDLFDPETNIKLGTNYISRLMKKYDNCTSLALAAYNAGSGNVDSWISNGTIRKDGKDVENIPYKETNNYVRKILNDYNVYIKLYE